MPRSAIPRSPKSAGWACSATSGSWARSTTSRTSCAAPTSCCCPPRASRSDSRHSRRWRAGCPSWPAGRAGCRRSSSTGKAGSSPRSAPSIRWSVAVSSCSRTQAACSGCEPRRSSGRRSSRPIASYPSTKRCIRKYSMGDVLRLLRAHNLLVAAIGVVAGGWIALGEVAAPKVLFFAAVAAVAAPAVGLVPWSLAAWLHLGREMVKDLDDEEGDRLLGRRTLPIALGRSRAAGLAALTLETFVLGSLVVPWRAGYRDAYFPVAAIAQVIVVLAAARLHRGRTHGVSRWLKVATVVGLTALWLGKTG